MCHLCKVQLSVLSIYLTSMLIDELNELIVGSYGSTLRYKSVERLKPIGKHSLLGASGEISDFQEIMRYLDELM
jgi:20S proteasome subunit beta 7